MLTKVNPYKPVEHVNIHSFTVASELAANKVLYSKQYNIALSSVSGRLRTEIGMNNATVHKGQ